MSIETCKSINEIYVDFIRICTGVKQSYQWSPILCMCLNDNMTTHQHLHCSPNLRIIIRVINSEVNMRPSMQGRSRPSSEGCHDVIRNATQTSQKRVKIAHRLHSTLCSHTSTPSCLPFPHIHETASTFSLSEIGQMLRLTWLTLCFHTCLGDIFFPGNPC